MTGFLCLLLHAHLPFVRHPEHAKFLEESWLFEAISETYLPLLRLLDRWHSDRINPRLTLTLTPTLCAMLRDPLLQERYRRHLDGLVELSEKELQRTHWEPSLHELAGFYHARFCATRDFYVAWSGDLVTAFRQAQDLGMLEIITSAATHALLPLLADDPLSLRAQIFVARDEYRECFGRDPRGIWLPECAYVGGLEEVLREAGLRWFMTDAHGILNARPRPRYAMFAPILTPNGIAVFGRDLESARQVWSRDGGYPGDPRYRDFYRDIGFDLDLDYVRPHLPAADRRGFTGIKYHRITGPGTEKGLYNAQAAVEAAQGHAAHFLQERMTQVQRLTAILKRPPLVLSPYDAELFGHWWYEGPEFLDAVVRKACRDQNVFRLATPEDYLEQQPVHQVATPAASSWGEAGYWRIWLNDKNQWIYPHLRVAQARMAELVRRFPTPGGLEERALRQAARELLLAQASDWPFILHTGTSPDYASSRVECHVGRFTALYEQLLQGRVCEQHLSRIEWQDNLFPWLNYRYWGQFGSGGPTQ